MFWVGIVISYGKDCSRSNHSMMMPVLQQQSTEDQQRQIRLRLA